MRAAMAALRGEAKLRLKRGRVLAIDDTSNGAAGTPAYTTLKERRARRRRSTKRLSSVVRHSACYEITTPAARARP